MQCMCIWGGSAYGMGARHCSAFHMQVAILGYCKFNVVLLPGLCVHVSLEIIGCFLSVIFYSLVNFNVSDSVFASECL